MWFEIEMGKNESIKSESVMKMEAKVLILQN